jgi:hypothetical protein
MEEMERWGMGEGRETLQLRQMDWKLHAWPPVKLASFIIDCPLRDSSLCLSTFRCAALE